MLSKIFILNIKIIVTKNINKSLLCLGTYKILCKSINCIAYLHK